ncbi:hypothetical protein FEZ48_12280 [Marinilactibacillus psychrotolerans]|uniref:Uncharacterized protein n=1 Tax=Marinilactibacillus psychrotolerans TaxID=191770 RepID=A0A5R9BXQ9_9LACT|nr:hypothetical protein [Marinilactibacillus psychrotolerans]TLQ05514.1 hypothetical protein FEZ48_12280 [Marinilactibacillus psychrotolerans]
MEVTNTEVKHYFEELQQQLLKKQAHWEQVDPYPHAVGVLMRANRLGWHEKILPEIENAIHTLEDIDYRKDFIN